MSDPEPKGPRDTSGGPDPSEVPGAALPQVSDPAFEDLVFRLLERRADHGEGVLEQFCASHPEMATRLRARLGELDAGGLLGNACDEGVWPVGPESGPKAT